MKQDNADFDSSSYGDGRFNVSNQVLDHQQRLATLEERSRHFATKEDLQKELIHLFWKIIIALAGLVAGVYWMARNIYPT